MRLLWVALNSNAHEAARLSIVSSLRRLSACGVPPAVGWR